MFCASKKGQLQDIAEALRAERNDAHRADWERADAEKQALTEALAERDHKLRTQGRKMREGEKVDLMSD
jgi:hypothetical protein